MFTQTSVGNAPLPSPQTPIAPIPVSVLMSGLNATEAAHFTSVALGVQNGQTMTVPAGACAERGRPDAPGCLILAIEATNAGLQGLHRQVSVEDPLPIIVWARESRLDFAVHAMRIGAFHVFDSEATTPDAAIARAIRGATEQDMAVRASQIELRDFRHRHRQLSEAERTVTELILDGVPNKVVASRTGVSIRTIEMKRSQAYSKMGVDSLAHLVQRLMKLRFAESDRRRIRNAANGDDP